jgi:GH25 family lysozyme M1 (1,4-beta-N-acetylmuramidase)
MEVINMWDLLIDVSEYNGQLDWEVIADHTPQVLLAYIRASEGANHPDLEFQANWANSLEASQTRKAARGIPLLRQPYHAFHPDDDIVLQAALFNICVQLDHGDLPPVIDVELVNGVKPAGIIAGVDQFRDELIKRGYQEPWIYTRTSFIQEYMTIGGVKWPGMNLYHFYLAQWLTSGAEDTRPLFLPDGMYTSNVLVHQTTCKGAPIGQKGYTMDYDRWLGTLDALYAYANMPNPFKPGLTLEQRVTNLEVIARAHGWEV